MSNKRQVGGTHYSQFIIEPVDLMVILNFNWFQGEILKYVSRFRDKNGKEDLDKAMSVSILAIERGLNQATIFSDDILEKNEKHIEEYVKQFFGKLDLDDLREIITSLVKNDYYHIRDIIYGMLIRYELIIDYYNG